MRPPACVGPRSPTPSATKTPNPLMRRGSQVSMEPQVGSDEPSNATTAGAQPVARTDGLSSDHLGRHLFIDADRFLGHPATRPLALVVFAVACVALVLHSSPLGWDESVFAARGHDLAQSNFRWSFRSGAYWGDYRAPGLPVLQSIAFTLLGASDVVARLVVVFSSVGSLFVVAKASDLWFRREVGTATVLLCATCPGFLATSTVGFADNPAFLFGAFAVLFLSRYSVLDDLASLALVPVSIWLATSIRYGAVMLIAAPLLVIGVWRIAANIRDRAWISLTQLVGAGLVSLVGVIVLLESRILTENASPAASTRALFEAGARPQGQWWDDLVDILGPGQVDTGFGQSFWSPTYAFLFLGLVALGATMLTVRRLWLPMAVGAFVAACPVALYALTVNQFVTTYFAPIFVSSAFVVACAIFGVSPRATIRVDVVSEPHVSSRGRSGLSRVRASIWAVVGVLVIGSSFVGVRRMHERLDVLEQVRAGATIADDLLGSDCAVGTGRVPQVAWYSTCRAVGLRGLEKMFDGENDESELVELGRRAGVVPGSQVGLLLLEGAGSQPNVEEAIGSIAADDVIVLTAGAGPRVVLAVVRIPIVDE